MSALLSSTLNVAGGPGDPSLQAPRPDAGLPALERVDAFVRACQASPVKVVGQMQMEDMVDACVQHARVDLIDRILDALPAPNHESVIRMISRQTVAAGQADVLAWLIERRETLNFPMSGWERMAAIHSAIRQHRDDPKVTLIIQAVGSGRPLDEACDMFSRDEDLQDLVYLLAAAPASTHEHLLAQWPQAADPARALIRHRQAQDRLSPTPSAARVRPRA